MKSYECISFWDGFTVGKIYQPSYFKEGTFDDQGRYRHWVRPSQECWRKFFIEVVPVEANE